MLFGRDQAAFLVLEAGAAGTEIIATDFGLIGLRGDDFFGGFERATSRPYGSNLVLPHHHFGSGLGS